MGTRTTQRLRDESGFALAMAVFALVILAAIVAGGYFSASQEFHIGRGMKSTTASFYAGEAGIREVIDDWDAVTYAGLLAGDSVSVGPIAFEGGGSYEATVVRVGSAADSVKRYFYVESVGRPPGPSVGERRQAVVVRASFPDLCCDAAARVRDRTIFSGGGQPIITGNNNDPPGVWPAEACAGILGDSAPGVITWQFSNVNDPSRVTGIPNIFVDPTQTTIASVIDSGDLIYSQLIANTDHTFNGDLTYNNSVPSTVDGECDGSDPLNWGEPDNSNHPCFDYYPIIRVTGNLNLTGAGSAQGILLVDSDLNITGPFEFYGIAIVQGDLNMGGPVDFYGGALVGDDLTFSGATPRFWLSRCASERAERLSKLTEPHMISPRAWVELF